MLELFISSVMNQWDKGEMLETDSRIDVDFESINCIHIKIRLKVTYSY